MKTFMRGRRVFYMIVIIVAYHAAFSLLYFDTGPPYGVYSRKFEFYFFYLYVVPSTICFFIVLLTTIVMVTRLKRNLQWRRETTQQDDKISDKDSKIVKTIIVTSSLFIICFSPNVLNFTAQAIYPNYSLRDPYLWSLIADVFCLWIIPSNIIVF